MVNTSGYDPTWPTWPKEEIVRFRWRSLFWWFLDHNQKYLP